jgi:thioredoxin-dependent peroxiredoxin
MLNIDEPAPAFSLPDQQGKVHSLSDYAGRWLVVYFYPKDMTPGCTTEACSFRDNYPQLKQKASIVGVSADSSKSHQKFADKHSLPFPLLSDESKDIIKAYQAWGPKKFMGREFLGTHRISYLVNPQGNIAKVYPKVNPKTHVEEVLQDLDTLQ